MAARRDPFPRSLLGWETPRGEEEKEEEEDKEEARVMSEFRKAYFNNYHVRKRFLQKQVARILVSRRAHAVSRTSVTVVTVR
jgi:hypothetical protein